MTFILILLLSAIVIGLVVRFIKKRPVTPDPWEGEVSEDDLTDDATKLCVNCLEPITDGKIHYCPKCGNVVGEYTRYIPYVNIPFNYSIFRTILNKIKNKF